MSEATDLLNAFNDLDGIHVVLIFTTLWLFFYSPAFRWMISKINGKRETLSIVTPAAPTSDATILKECTQGEQFKKHQIECVKTNSEIKAKIMILERDMKEVSRDVKEVSRDVKEIQKIIMQLKIEGVNP